MNNESNLIAGMILDGGLPEPSRTKDELKARTKGWIQRFTNGVHRADGRRFDVNESAVFAQSLEAMIARFLDKKYNNLLAKEMVPMANGLPRGAMTIAGIGFDHSGEATILSSYGEDIALADINARKMSTPVVGFASAWRMTIEQIEAAAMSGLPLNEKGLMAAKRIVATREDEILSLGLAAAGIQGATNITGATLGNLTTGTWSAATADQICADVSTAISDMVTATNNVYRPDTCYLPTSDYTTVESLPRFANAGPTVLEWMESKFKLTIKQWDRLDGAGAGAVDRFMLFVNDPDVVEGYTTIAPEQLAPEYRSTYWKTITHARCGGCNSANALGIRYADNI